MTNIKSYSELKRAVENTANVTTITMQTLREIHGVGRLGKHVIDGISKELEGVGLKSYPAELPANQWETVRIYKAGTPVADLISAVTNPSEETDAVLREYVEGDQQEILNKVRELVCG